MPKGPKVSDTYLYWTNKGGVGKTTLCFHSVVAYAELHPQTNVIVVDTDEQANLSQVLLTGENTGEANCTKLREDTVNTVEMYPRTLCGALLASKENNIRDCVFTTEDGTMLEKESSFLVNPNREGYNKSIPSNVYLLCGDPRIVTLVPDFQADLNAPVAREIVSATGMSKWGKLMSSLKNFHANASQQLSSGTDAKVFIDSNPSMTIWTQMALVASDKLIVPVNADDFSTAALKNMFFTVYGLYSFGGNLARYEKGMFHAIAEQQNLTMPKIHAIVHNRSTIFADSAHGNGFRAMNSAQSRTLFSAYKKAEEKGELSRIFNMDQLKPGHEIKDEDGFANTFTGSMRDMLTSAIATQHYGIPLWHVHRNRKPIKEGLNVKSVKQSASSSLQDLIGAEKKKSRSLMQLVQGQAIPGDKCAGVWNKFNIGKQEEPASSPATGSKRPRDE